MGKKSNQSAPKSQLTSVSSKEGVVIKEQTGISEPLSGGELDQLEKGGDLQSFAIAGNPEGNSTPEPEPEPESEEVKKLAPSTAAVRAALDKWKSVFGPRELQRTQKDANAAAESLKRAYSIALADKENVVANMKLIMQEFHSEQDLYRDTTLYAGSPSLDRGFFMRMTQWIYTITRVEESQWGEEMADIGYAATQQIAKECPSPSELSGFEVWLSRVYPS